MATNTEEFTQTSEGGAQRLTDAAGDIAQQATSVAEQRASSTMSQVGDALDQVAQAIRSAGNNLRSEQPQVAGFADTAAHQVERAGQYLQERDAGEVLDGAQDFARRQPAVVVGAGLALGLLVGRALKTANGSGTSYDTDRSRGKWNGGTRYAAVGSYGDTGYGSSSTYEATGGYGASDDYAGGAAASSTDLAGDVDLTTDTTSEGER